jgi:hypothetical protein
LQGRINDIREIALFARMLKLYASLAKVHQHLIDRQTVQPGRKSRIAAKAPDLPKNLQEDLLREVFGLGRVADHPQTERIDPAAVLLV